MVRAALAFFILALVAYVLGATGLAGLSVDIGQTLLVVFLVLAIISFGIGLISGRNPKSLP